VAQPVDHPRLVEGDQDGIFSVIPGHEENWRADAVTWSEHNTEAFAGLHNKGKRIVVITDESSKIADKVWEVIEGALTDEEDGNPLAGLWQPDQNTGRFRECFGKHRNCGRRARSTAATVEGTNKAYLQSIIDTYGEDSDIAKVRVLGQFPSASSMQFIPRIWSRQCPQAAKCSRSHPSR
jgi:hypothetical protein